jgi:DAK2 domain fusion protein YloV
MKTLNGTQIRRMLTYGYGLLDKNREAVDALNVFPVPDGDTGINMSLTLKSVVKELETVTSNDLTTICDTISRGALKGARGNSGVILSQIIKGIMAELSSLKTAGADTISTKAFAKAMERGTATAYKAVTVPKEGTMLTVIRVMGEEADKIARGENEFENFFERVIAKGEETLAQTPEMLPVLKKAGVVDAGGRGVLIMFSGFLAVLKGEEIEINFSNDKQAESGGIEMQNLDELGEIEFAYCTEFMITHMYKSTTIANIDSLRDKYMKLGDSVVVVGDLELVKVHVHTNTPGIAITDALNLGEIINLKIDNMLEQNRALRAKMNIVDKEIGIAAVAAGDGIASVFKDLGCDVVIKGGQTMNPSAEDIAKAVRRVHAKNIFVFPNNKNITLAAKHAQALVDTNIIVIPTKSINEGITACVTFDPDGTVEENTHSFLMSIETVKSASVTYAVRTTKVDGLEIQQGDIIGLNDKAIIAKGKTANEVAVKVVGKMIDPKISNITVFYGADMREKDADDLQDKLLKKYPNVEINLLCGGQPVYYYLISLE